MFQCPTSSLSTALPETDPPTLPGGAQVDDLEPPDFLFRHWHVFDRYIFSGTISFAVKGSRYGRKDYVHPTDCVFRIKRTTSLIMLRSSEVYR